MLDRLFNTLKKNATKYEKKEKKKRKNKVGTFTTIYLSTLGIVSVSAPLSSQ